MSFQRPPVGPEGLPPEIAFLLDEGVDARLLVRAAAAATAAGTDAATALMNAGLIAESAYYAALARALGAPYLDGPIPFGLGLRFPDSLVAGLAPLAPGAVAPWVYQRITETYVLDPAMRERMAALNPTASAKVAQRLIEAHRRGFWTPDSETRDALDRAEEELEDRLEGITATIPAGVAA